MPSLIVSAWDLPAAKPLAEAARKRRWTALSFKESDAMKFEHPIVVYSGTDLAESISQRFSLRLVEPALDLLSKVPYEFRLRPVELTTAGMMRGQSELRFIKPADPRRRIFDAGIYRSLNELRQPLPPNLPLLVAEPVEFSTEYRLFMAGSTIHAGSPYMVGGRPAWQPFGKGGEKAVLSKNLADFAKRLNEACRDQLPAVYVVDVGLIEDRGWAVVEFNPVWCSGILGADPDKVLDVLKLAAVPDRLP